jgi:hypothetical protein
VFGLLVVELAFVGRGCLDVSFCVEVYASEIVSGCGFNLLCPFSLYFEGFFLLELYQCSSERGVQDMLPLVGFLLWCRLPLSSPGVLAL